MADENVHHDPRNHAALDIEWPRRRPFSPPELRLRGILSTNVRSELIGKVSLTIVTIVVNSPWMWLLWAAQFVVLTGVWFARSALEHDRSDRALIILVLGHRARRHKATRRTRPSRRSAAVPCRTLDSVRCCREAPADT